MNSLILEEHRQLFKDDASFNKFVDSIGRSMTSDFATLISNEKVLGSVLSPEATKEFLYERMIRRISSERDHRS